MEEARQIMPGGVSSPVRAFKSVGGEPVVFDRVKGSKAYDVDGNEYVDYVGTWGPVCCADRHTSAWPSELLCPCLGAPPTADDRRLCTPSHRPLMLVHPLTGHC